MRSQTQLSDNSYTGQYAADFVTPGPADLSGLALKATKVNTTAPITGGGDLSVDRTLAMAASAHGVDGYLKGVDWDTFNGKQAALGFTPAADSSVVHTTGAENVGGVKTFTSGISFGNETLANYDEGTWSPSAVSLGGTGITYDTVYTRIGNRVDFTLLILGTGMTATANTTTITLPFTPAKRSACSVTNTSVAAYGPGLIYTDGKLYLPTIPSTSTILVSGTLFL